MIAVLNMPMYHMSTTPQNISEKATGTPIAMAPSREPIKTRSVMVSALRKLFDRQVLARELGDFVFRDAARQKRYRRSSAITNIRPPVNMPMP